MVYSFTSTLAKYNIYSRQVMGEGVERKQPVEMRSRYLVRHIPGWF